MTRWCLSGMLAVATMGCGDDAVPGCDPDASCVAPGSSSSGGGSDLTNATTPPDTGPVTSTTRSDGSGSSGAPTTTSPGTSSSGGSTGADSSGGDGSTGAAGNVVYTAVALPGGLDRIRVLRKDLDLDQCMWMVLVAPSMVGPYPGVTTPAGWSVESISINDVGAACDSDTPAMFGSEPATMAAGGVTFGPLGMTGVYPCELDVDMTADFAGLLPGIGPTETMTAVAVPVTGC